MGSSRGRDRPKSTSLAFPQARRSCRTHPLAFGATVEGGAATPLRWEDQMSGNRKIDLTGMLISCDECRMQGTDACNDCVVTHILNRPEGAVVFDAAQERAIRELARAGLLPDV